MSKRKGMAIRLGIMQEVIESMSPLLGARPGNTLRLPLRSGTLKEKARSLNPTTDGVILPLEGKIAGVLPREMIGERKSKDRLQFQDSQIVTRM